MEVFERDGLARVVSWRPKEGVEEVRTPVILFITSQRFPCFRPAEAYLVNEGDEVRDLDPSVPVINDAGGPFIPRDDGDGATIPATIPPGRSCPTALVDHIRDGPGVLSKDGRTLIIGPKAPSGIDEGVELVVDGNIQGLLGDPKRLVTHISDVRRAIGYSRLLYAPGTGRPDHLALLSYLGVDLFDSVPLVLSARKGQVLFPEGVHARKDLVGAGLCHCEACREGDIDHDGNLVHNYLMALHESKRVRHAIRQGMARELVETRIRSAPWMVAALRELDLRHHDIFERYLPISKAFMLASSRESLHRPEVVRFQRRLRERYGRPPMARVLLLLPCSARKPYSTSSTHRAISEAVARCRAQDMVHKVVLTSPLGVVPMDLELFYPANVYDIAVTGDWDGPEIDMIRDGLKWLLSTGDYDGVVSYIDGMPFIDDLLVDRGNTIVLRPKNPRRKEDLDVLVSELDKTIDLVRMMEKEGVVTGKTRWAEDLASFAEFQFGPGGRQLVERMRRSRQHSKVFARKEMTGTLNDDRGLISLTLKGGEILLRNGLYVVEIEDFEPKGTVFAVGVKGASDTIRPGDDVVVSKGGELVGVGVALMSGPEMVGARRGGAVNMRHRRK